MLMGKESYVGANPMRTMTAKSNDIAGKNARCRRSGIRKGRAVVFRDSTAIANLIRGDQEPT